MMYGSGRLYNVESEIHHPGHEMATNQFKSFALAIYDCKHSFALTLWKMLLNYKCNLFRCFGLQVYKVILPIICVFGLFGNFLSFFLLTRFQFNENVNLVHYKTRNFFAKYQSSEITTRLPKLLNWSQEKSFGPTTSCTPTWPAWPSSTPPFSSALFSGVITISSKVIMSWDIIFFVICIFETFRGTLTLRTYHN